MSRIGKQPITIPSGVEVTITPPTVSVKGPKGTLQQTLHDHVSVSQEADILRIQVKDQENVFDRGLWGLSQRLIQNMVTGVTRGFEKQLELHGVGYKVALSENGLTLHLGFSHPVQFILPVGVEAKVEKNVITLSGIDKQMVGEIAAHIRSLRKPEPYKGKGIRYVGEVIRMKAGKAAKAGAK